MDLNEQNIQKKKIWQIKYYHPRNDGTCPQKDVELGEERKNKQTYKKKSCLNCDSGSSPVYFFSLWTGSVILSSIFQKEYCSMSYIGWMFLSSAKPPKWTDLILKAWTVTIQTLLYFFELAGGWGLVFFYFIFFIGEWGGRRRLVFFLFSIICKHFRGSLGAIFFFFFWVGQFLVGG